MKDILIKLLNGNNDIVDKIILMKTELEMEDARIYHINNYNIKKKKKDDCKNIINNIITYPHSLVFYNIDDLYHNDIFTNKFGHILSLFEQLFYLEKIYFEKLNKVIYSKDYIYYEFNGYLIKYRNHI